MIMDIYGVLFSEGVTGNIQDEKMSNWERAKAKGSLCRRTFWLEHDGWKRYLEDSVI